MKLHNRIGGSQEGALGNKSVAATIGTKTINSGGMVM